jgi:hypothetical protein
MSFNVLPFAGRRAAARSARPDGAPAEVVTLADRRAPRREELEAADRLWDALQAEAARIVVRALPRPPGDDDGPLTAA